MELRVLYILSILVCVQYAISAEIKPNATSICDHDGCLCQLDNDQTDLPKMNVDCSYNEPLLFVQEYYLPDNTNLLDLSANNLTSIETVANVLKSTTITRLYLNRNLLQSINSDNLQLPSLLFLDLSDNLLSEIKSSAFDHLKSLNYLNLASNQFKTFSPNNFKSVGILKVLILDDNQLGDFFMKNNLFRDNGLNTEIELLSLENVGLNTVPENFVADAGNMRQWRLSRNNLTVIPELPFTLEHLDVSDNPITEIDSEDFSNTPALKILILNNLDLEVIEEYTLASLKSLEKLELKGNRKLKEFNSLAFGDEVLDDADDFVLSTLSFRGSSLSTLDEELLEPFSRLSELDLQGNPWNCDCHLIWIKSLNIPEEFTDHIRCFRPLPLYNSRLFEAEDSSLTCPSPLAAVQRVGAYLVSAVALVLLFVAVWVFVVVPRRYSRRELLQNEVSPTSPYSRITIDPNAAEDYR